MKDAPGRLGPSEVGLEKRERRKVLAFLIPGLSTLLGCVAYVFYMHLMVVSTVMVGELIQANHGFVQTTRSAFYVDGNLSAPQGRHLEVRKTRSGSESLCSIPFNVGSRPVCVNIVKRNEK